MLQVPAPCIAYSKKAAAARGFSLLQQTLGHFGLKSSGLQQGGVGRAAGAGQILTRN